MNQDQLLAKFCNMVEENYGGDLSEVTIPPHVFTSMKAEFVTIDREKGYMEVKFPVQENSLNPFGNMQGGMIAAAIDNTIGPLSMIVAPMNFTRDLEVKYRRVVKGSFDYITVSAEFTDRKQRRLFFSASVKDPEGNLLAGAKAMNWIVDRETE